MRSIRCAIMRGGSSKAVVFAQPDLPLEGDARDRAILAAFGSPDPRQVDGLGGADPLTSKVAIVAGSSRAGTDVDYTFGQVAITSPHVNYAFSCGNTAAAVALYAVEERHVGAPASQTAEVRIHCTNNGKRISAQVRSSLACEAQAQRAASSGQARAGSSVRLEFHDPGGGETGSLLPSGDAVNEIRTASGTLVRFSLVDCGNLYAIIPASTWSLTGSESPGELDCAQGLLCEIEELREAIPARFLPNTCRPESRNRLAGRLKVALVGRPSEIARGAGGSARDDAADIVARIVNPECVHKAFAVTGAMNLAAAAAVPGSVVAELLDGRPPARHGRDVFRIRHPQGVIAPEVVFAAASGQPAVSSVFVDRTARRIMDGLVYLPGEQVSP